MNATLEGQTTAHYLAERLEGYPVRLTQLAHGLPVGGELDYLDEGTLAQALRARRPVGCRRAFEFIPARHGHPTHPRDPGPPAPSDFEARQIGRALCRERGCQ